jgi:hypothetical protein
MVEVKRKPPGHVRKRLHQEVVPEFSNQTFTFPGWHPVRGAVSIPALTGVFASHLPVLIVFLSATV